MILLAALFLQTIFNTGPARAIDTLPYPTRTLSYPGLGTTVRGDIRTVGMAGATVGLGDTLIASFDNPAGLAMTAHGIDTAISSNSIRDISIQSVDSPMTANSWGLTLQNYPWGYGIGYTSNFRENNTYLPPLSPADDPPFFDIYTREFRVSVARVFWNNRVSLGASFNLGQSTETMSFTQPTDQNVDTGAYAVGGTFGALFQLPERTTLGIGYSVPMHYALSGTQGSARFPGFIEPIEVPFRLGVGTGWIPNRFFRMDLSFTLLGRTPGTALLRDQAALVGDSRTFEPHMGLAYQFADFREIRGTVFGGSYIETSRIEGTNTRLHFTGGMEAKIWVFSFGWGLDAAANYKNYIASIGIDVIRTMEKLKLIPTGWRPPLGGLLPKPFILSDEGLPRPLVKDWQSHHDVNPIDAGLNIPKRVKEQVKSTTGRSVFDAISSIPGAVTDEVKDMRRVQQQENTREKKLQKQHAEDLNDGDGD